MIAPENRNILTHSIHILNYFLFIFKSTSKVKVIKFFFLKKKKALSLPKRHTHVKYESSRPRGYKKISMLNSAAHKIYLHDKLYI